MSRTATKVLALTAASGLAVVGFFLTKPAFAGTNGQQVQVCQQPFQDYTKAVVQGFNQEGTFTSASLGMAPGGCGTLTGHFWVGGVTVEVSGSSTVQPDQFFGCDVPKEQEGSDVTTCFL